MTELLVDSVEQHLYPVGPPSYFPPCGHPNHLARFKCWRHTSVDRLSGNPSAINTWMSVPEKSDRPKLQLHHRPVEIERKFLVANNEWRQSAVSSVSIRDGLIAIYKDRKVRVRISGDVATIAIKGPRIGIGRPEFEYEISMADAEGIFSTICQDDTLEKQRFFVQDAGATWQVDVYDGILQGIVIAEIELKQEGQQLSLPRWIGKEVTGDSLYKKVNMRARALKARHEGH